MKLVAVIASLLLSAHAWAGIAPSSMQWMLQAASYPVEEAAGGYLSDRSYFEIVTSNADQLVYVQVTTGSTVTVVDWGDGNTATVSASSTISNTYASADSYELTVRGGCVSYKFGLGNAGEKALRTILTVFQGTPNLNSCNGQFVNAKFLTNAPLHLMTNQSLVANIGGQFQECSAARGSTPTYVYCPLLTTANNTFLNSAFQSTPYDAWTNSPFITALNGAYSTCGSMTGQIPTLVYNTNVTTYASFAINSKFTISPPWDHITNNVKSVNCSKMYDGLTALVGPIPALPPNASAIDEYIYGCTNAGFTGTVEMVFSVFIGTNCSDAERFAASTVGYVRGLTGNGSFMTNRTWKSNFTFGPLSTNSSYRALYRCSNLNDYTDLTMTNWTEYVAP